MPGLGTDAERVSAILQGYRGPADYEYQLWRSDITGREISLLPVEGATLSIDNLRSHTWELGLNLLDDGTFDPATDYAKLVIMLRVGDDSVRYDMGHYRFMETKGTASPLALTYDLVGMSPEHLLTLWGPHDTGYFVAKNDWLLQHCRNILINEIEIPESQIAFPPVGFAPYDQQSPNEIYFDPFEDTAAVYWIEIVNTLLAAAGHYALWTDRNGRFTTREIEDDPLPRPDLRYGNRGDAERLIVDEIEFVEGAEEWANLVYVYGGDPNVRPPIVGEARNNDPDSPVSYASIGYWKQAEPFVEESIATQAQANKLAKAHLRRLSGMQRRLTVHSVPDPRVGPRQTMALDVIQDNGRELWNGRFKVESVNMPLDLSAMTQEIYQEVRV